MDLLFFDHVLESNCEFVNDYVLVEFENCLEEFCYVNIEAIVLFNCIVLFNVFVKFLICLFDLRNCIAGVASLFRQCEEFVRECSFEDPSK